MPKGPILSLYNSGDRTTLHDQLIQKEDNCDPPKPPSSSKCRHALVIILVSLALLTLVVHIILVSSVALHPPGVSVTSVYTKNLTISMDYITNGWALGLLFTNPNEVRTCYGQLKAHAGNAYEASIEPFCLRPESQIMAGVIFPSDPPLPMKGVFDNGKFARSFDFKLHVSSNVKVSGFIQSWFNHGIKIDCPRVYGAFSSSSSKVQFRNVLGDSGCYTHFV